MSGEFDFERLFELCRRAHEETRRSAARAVDRSLVVRYWLFGWIGRGFSVDTLERMRRFYMGQEDILSDVRASDISATPLRIFVSAANPKAALRLRSWTIPRRRLGFPAVGPTAAACARIGWRGEPCP